jgi:hypothetical protein
MRSFKKFQETLKEKKREARNRIFTNKEFPSWRDSGFQFISCWEANLLCCYSKRIIDADHYRCDKFHSFGFSKNNMLASVNNMLDKAKTNVIHDPRFSNKDKDFKGFLEVVYEQRYDLYNNLQREGELHENYIPEVDFVELDIWNSKEGWLF